MGLNDWQMELRFRGFRFAPRADVCSMLDASVSIALLAAGVAVAPLRATTVGSALLRAAAFSGTPRAPT